MKRFILPVCLCMFLFSCGTSQIEGPAESYLPSELAPAISEIPLEFEVDVKKLETSVNNKLNGLLYEGNNLSDKDLSVKIWKAQNFAFFINNNEITYRVPLKVWSRFGWKIEKLGFSVSDQYEATGVIALVYKTSISIDKDWKLVSTTTSSGYEWIQAPKLKVVGVQIPVTPIANIALNHFDDVINAQIDKALTETVDLKKYVSQAWDVVQKPMLISDTNHLWLKVVPKDVFVSPFTTKGNKLNLSIALYTQLESVIGAEPAQSAKIPLPAFKNVARQPQQFNLNIGADVTFAKIAELAKSQLLNKTFSEGGKSIKITNLSLYSSAGKAVFVADVTGSLKGRVYFSGKLIHNPDKNTLEVSEPEFDISTRNALVKSANWLLHGMILKKITPYLSYPLTQVLEDARKDVNNMIADYSVYDGVSLRGKLDQISVTSVGMVPGAVRIQANLKGNVGIKIGDIKF